MSSLKFETDGDTVTLMMDKDDLSRIMLSLYHLAQSGGPIIDPEGEPYRLTDVGMAQLIDFYNELDEYAASFYLDAQAEAAAEIAEVVKDG